MYFCEICHGLTLCDTLHFFISMVQLFCIFSDYVNVKNLLKFKMACSQKLIKSMADIAQQICQIKRRSDENFLLKRAKDHFFNDMVIKMSPGHFPVICYGYVKYHE